MELELAEGWVEAELAEEFPQLGVVHAPLAARPGRSPVEVKERLRQLADRYTGGHVIHMRQDAVPWAYRVFARQVGIDPDTDRTPVEAIALERLRRGGFKSQQRCSTTPSRSPSPRPASRCSRSTPTGWRASPGCACPGPASGSPACARFRRARSWWPTTPRPVAVVLGEVSHEAGVTPATERMILCALRVKGVPPIAVEEALWTAAEVLVGAD